MGQNQVLPMTPYEVEQSAKRGNAIAHKIARNVNNRPKYNSAIRHQLATGGIHNATALACQLLGMNHADACKHIAALLNSKPDDIVSPHWE